MRAKEKRDILSLRRLARSLGGTISIRTENKPSEDAGYFIYADKKVIAIRSKNDSWKQIIMCLIHEVSHLLGHNINGNDKVFSMAFKHVDKEMEEWPKKTRKAFFQLEKRDIKLMSRVWRMAKIKTLTLEEVVAEQFYDTQVYEFYSKSGRHLDGEQRRELRDFCKKCVGL